MQCKAGVGVTLDELALGRADGEGGAGCLPNNFLMPFSSCLLLLPLSRLFRGFEARVDRSLSALKLDRQLRRVDAWKYWGGIRR